MKARSYLLVVGSIFSLVLSLSKAQGQGTVFTYQGRLVQDGIAANGTYEFRFGWYTNVSTGTLVGSFQTNSAVAVSNSLFTTALDFSNAFSGAAYWLDIGVRTNGSASAFTPLTPRQPIRPVPYAITAGNLTGNLPASQLSGSLPASVLSGTFSNSVSFTNPANVFVGDGSSLTGVPGITHSNFLYAYDTTAQFVSSAGAFQNVSISTSSANGWLVANPGQFVANQTGVYLVQYQAHFANGSTSVSLTAGIRALLNLTSTPVELTSSESVIYVPASSIGEVSRSFLLTMTAGQMLSFQMTGSIANSTSGGYLISSTFFGQFFPSISVTVIRIQ